MNGIFVTAPTLSVFVSHAADDPEWPPNVIEGLATELVSIGATVRLDYWYKRELQRDPTDQEWRDWMRDSLDRAHRVLILGSKAYVDLADRPDPTAGRGRGLAQECRDLDAWLYTASQKPEGRIWLCAAHGSALPRFLQAGQAVHYSIVDRSRMLQDMWNSWQRPLQMLHARLRAMLDDECLEECYVTLTVKRSRKLITRLLVPLTQREDLERTANVALEWVPGDSAVDILDAVQPDGRALLLGEPGAGKTYALLKLVQRDLAAGTTPLWVKLNHWLNGSQTFSDFVAAEIPELGVRWAEALEAGRGRLLLDGLNELPSAHAKAQRDQIENWLRQNGRAPVLVTCRSDHAHSCNLPSLIDALTLSPLQASQVWQLVRNYVRGESVIKDALFWEIAGGRAFQYAWERRPEVTAESQLNVLIEPTALGAGDLAWLESAEIESLRRLARDPARFWPLAVNPYMLTMLLSIAVDDIWEHGTRSLPRHRVDVLSKHTEARINNELRKQHNSIESKQIQLVLTELAARLQHVAERASDGRDASVIAIAWEEIEPSWHPALEVALGARLLRREGRLLRFGHQLLHEFYVARYLRALLDAGSDSLAHRIWPGASTFSERTGWLQPFLFLAEYQHTDVVSLLRALAQVQPEVAAAVWEQTRNRSPWLLDEQLSDEIVRGFSEEAFTSPGKEFPQREASFARAIGLMRGIHGNPLDTRRGVHGWHDKVRKRTRVDIDWVRLGAGPSGCQGMFARIDRDYLISRYPVTHGQFEAFVDDPQGWVNAKWWAGAPTVEQATPWQPCWTYSNHPCERVSWWAARAYCRWLAALLRRPGITIPSGEEWERAAGGPGSANFPWCGVWSNERANADSMIDMTSAVGLFAAGSSLEDIHDLAGNVWEWTLDAAVHDDARNGSEDFSECPIGESLRVIRGGSWRTLPKHCGTRAQKHCTPDSRLSSLGFRVVCHPGD